jgi:hypothetical protein
MNLTGPIFVSLGILAVLGGCAEQTGDQDAQAPDTLIAACDYPEAHQFDFWLGEWQLSWADTGSGTNTVQRILNGCVIQESFSGEGFEGISMSTFDLNTETWKQTWVDNSGGYLDFSGSWQNDRMILQRAVQRDGVGILQRMVWYNISTDTLDWNWEASRDGGRTWDVLWKIDYTRRNSKGS